MKEAILTSILVQPELGVRDAHYGSMQQPSTAMCQLF